MTCVRPNRYHDTGFEPEPDNLKGLFKKSAHWYLTYLTVS